MFFRIVLPLLKPITATVAALHVLWMWNEYNVSIILLQKSQVRTLPIQQYFFFGEYTSNLNLAFASALLAMVPIVIFFMIAQKFIVEGLIDGAVKT
jgi:raffinose/stachyose/melibiose transport system permease protein